MKNVEVIDFRCTLTEECESFRKNNKKIVDNKHNLELNNFFSIKNETSSICKDTTLAESESVRKRDIYKSKVKEEKFREKSERRSYYVLKNLFKKNIVKKSKKKIADFFDETQIQVNLITDLQSFPNTARQSKNLVFPEIKTSIKKEIFLKTSKSNIKSNSDVHIVNERKSKTVLINSKDKLKIMDLYRNGTRSKTFNEINDKLQGKIFPQSDCDNGKGKTKNLFEYFTHTKTINFQNSKSEDSLCNKDKKDKFIENSEKEYSDSNNQRQFGSVMRLKEKLRNENFESLGQELKLISPGNFRLVSPYNFSLKFQTDSKFNEIETENNEEKKKTYFKQFILKQKTSNKNSLKNDLMREIESIEKEKNEGTYACINNFTIEHRKNILHKWKKMIISAAIHFQKLNLTLEEFFSRKFHSIKPYENIGSYELFQAIKNGDHKAVSNLIEENKFLVHDYDYFNQTALHWAAKRNRYTIIPILISKGANINSEDISGRTPLHIAAVTNHLESLKILLYEMADPFKRNKEGKLPIDLTVDRKCKFYLSRARILHIIHAFGSVKKSHERIKFGFEFFFNNIEKEMFTDDCLNKKT